MTEFLDQYERLNTPQARTDFLKIRYPILAQQKITAKQIMSVFGRNHIGRLEKTVDGYELSVEGDDDFRGYLTFHEVLHIWLEQTGRFVNVFHDNPTVQEFLFIVKNMIDDFLIETEIVKQCGDYYESDVGYTKDKQILNNMGGLGFASGIRIAIEGMLFMALSEFYPSFKKLKTHEMFTTGLKHPNTNSITKLLNRYSSSITPEQYSELFVSICKLLTAVEIKSEDGKFVFSDQDKLLEWIKEVNNTFANIKATFQNLMRMPKGDA